MAATPTLRHAILDQGGSELQGFAHAKFWFDPYAARD
jgi:hypothetical protein